MTSERYLVCETCNDDIKRPHTEMVTHCKEKHSVDIEHTKGTRQMIMHGDGARFYTYTYRWTFGAIHFLDYQKYSRSKDSSMYH